MNDAVFERLAHLLGPEGVERDPKGLPRAVPESDDALALVCQAAQDEGWRFRLEGNASWLPAVHSMSLKKTSACFNAGWIRAKKRSAKWSSRT